MTGEWAQLSPRVKRQLPQSLLGRTFLTWFNPGSGTGYVFAVANLAAVTALTCGAALAAEVWGLITVDVQEIILFGVLLCAYVAVYLGVGRLIALWLRRFLYFGLLLPLVIHVVLLALGVGVPSFVQAWLFGFAEFEDYSVLQAPNWAWTLIEVVEGKILNDPAVPILVVASAVVVFFANLVAATKEVEQEREAVPQRVILDDLVLHPERAAVAKKSSPFDD